MWILFTLLQCTEPISGLRSAKIACKQWLWLLHSILCGCKKCTKQYHLSCAVVSMKISPIEPTSPDIPTYSRSQLNINTNSGIFDSLSSWFFGPLISLLIHEYTQESGHTNKLIYTHTKMMLSLTLTRNKNRHFYWSNIYDKINAISK